MPVTFAATMGKSQGTLVFSGEIPAISVLKFASRQNYDKVAGFDLSLQKGVNRPWDQKRSYLIAKGMEQRLANRQPLEHGAIILVDTNKGIKFSLIRDNAVDITVDDQVKLLFIDRQHSSGALEIAQKEPEKFPHLSNYANDVNNTLTVKLIQCDERESRKRFEILNHQPKALSPVDKMWASAINALDCEEIGDYAVYKDNLPQIVSFMAWHGLAENKESVWYDKLTIDSTNKPSPKKSAIPIKHLVDETAAIYREYERLDPEFSKLSISEQVEIISGILNVWWNTLARFLPVATGEKWYNYLLLKRGARIIMKIMAGMIRMFADKRNKKNVRPEETFMAQTPVYDFCVKTIPEYIAKAVTQGQSAFNDDEYWNDTNQGHGLQNDEEDRALVYMWKKINIYGSGKWSGYINSINTNEWTNRKRTLREKDGQVSRKETEEEIEA